MARPIFAAGVIAQLLVLLSPVLLARGASAAGGSLRRAGQQRQGRAQGASQGALQAAAAWDDREDREARGGARGVTARPILLPRAGFGEAGAEEGGAEEGAETAKVAKAEAGPVHGGVRALLEDPAKGEAKGLGGWTVHHVCGSIIFLTFATSMCLALPIVSRERRFFDDHVAGSGDAFGDYLGYRFTDWFTQKKYAPSLVLLFLTAGLIVTGAILYAVLVGGSPSHGLWRIFVWSTGSPAEGEGTVRGRFLGTVVTVAGLIILSLLLGIVTEVFHTKMSEIRGGVSRVVEGGHVVILGYTECTRCLIEELANARESEGGGIFVVLAEEAKEVVEASVTGDSVDLGSSRVIVRSGNPAILRDLHRVAAGSASQIVILADSSLSPEDADNKSIRTLLSLKTKGWPSNGRIVVQCCTEANREIFRELYEDHSVEVVVVGNIVAKLMAQGSQQHGLASVFGMMLGFEGDEFYMEEWPELVGGTFREAVFRFEQAVALGVMTADAKCLLNPGWNYKIQEGERIIVLAEDNDTYEPREEVWYSDKELPSPVSNRRQAKKGPRDAQPSSVLIIGWNPKIGPLLQKLDELVGPGSTVVSYSDIAVEERETEISKLQQGKKYQAFDIKHLQVEGSELTSKLELSKIKPHTFDSVFILADPSRSRTASDERTTACLAKLQQEIMKAPESERKMFDPVVEMCEDSTAEHLKICGFTNFVHSNSLVSQALAAVTEEPLVNSVYADLMSGVSNQFEFRRLDEFAPEGEVAPAEVSFWEVAHMVSMSGDITVVAWTDEDDAGQRVFQMNPKDKLSKRSWTSEDRIAVIRRMA